MLKFLLYLCLPLLALNTENYRKVWDQLETGKDKVDRFYDDLFFSLVIDDPQTLSQLGLFDAKGLKEHKSFLTDVSPKSIQKQFGTVKSVFNRLQNFSTESLSEEQKTSYKIIYWGLEQCVKGEKYLFHDYKVNQMFSTLSSLTLLLTQFHPLDAPEDVESFIARLEKVSVQIEQTIQLMAYQKKLGIVPPSFALDKVRQNIQKVIADNPYYSCLKGHADEDQLKKAAQIIKENINPTLKKLEHFCSKLPRHESGVWALPDGDHYYDYVLRGHTTTELTADEIHSIGLKEVEKIQGQMRSILASIGIADEAKGVGELMAELAKDPKFYFPNTDDGRSECLAKFEEILTRCREKLYPLFDLKPKTSVKILRVPQYEEDGAPAAYYLPPSLDGSRPGLFFANLKNMKAIPQFHMETLVMHEAEPGHHFQIALQQAMNIPMLRKLNDSFTAYVEGWALYAEKLAFEEKFYSSPHSELGHLQFDLLRAVRLVVDTGIHRMRWTRQQAIDYMHKVTGDHLENIVTEVERYFVMPGQACSYKIGQLKIIELREKMKAAWGENFDIRQFHNAVLELGAAPLTILKEKVESDIKLLKSKS